MIENFQSSIEQECIRPFPGWIVFKSGEGSLVGREGCVVPDTSLVRFFRSLNQGWVLERTTFSLLKSIPSLFRLFFSSLILPANPPTLDVVNEVNFPTMRESKMESLSAMNLVDIPGVAKATKSSDIHLRQLKYASQLARRVLPEEPCHNRKRMDHRY
jgi:hypothetical protein